MNNPLEITMLVPVSNGELLLQPTCGCGTYNGRGSGGDCGCGSLTGGGN